MDARLWERMMDVFALGVSDSDVITRHLHNMTVHEIYKGASVPRPSASVPLERRK